MTDASKPFTIRALADCGTTLDELRSAVLGATSDINLVLLRSQKGTPRFPPICPNCEQPADSTLRIERAFLFHVPSSDDTPNDRVASLDALDVPFCAACLHRQRAELSAPSPWTPIQRLLSEGESFAGVIVMGVAFLFVFLALKHLNVVPLLLAAIASITGFWLMRSTWEKSRHMSVPRPTNVDSAVDFTPYINLPYEPLWRAYQFRSKRYAERFREANLLQVWCQRSLEAQSAAAKRQSDSLRTNLIIGAVVLAVLLWSLWGEGFSQYIKSILKP